jgi:hypothetical protein
MRWITQICREGEETHKIFDLLDQQRVSLASSRLAGHVKDDNSATIAARRRFCLPDLLSLIGRETFGVTFYLIFPIRDIRVIRGFKSVDFSA